MSCLGLRHIILKCQYANLSRLPSSRSCLSLLQHLLRPSFHDYRHQFSTSNACRVQYQIKNNLEECFSLLNVSEDCTLDQLKAAYFKMAKMYHPDSQASTADAKKFDQVKEAYKAIKHHMEAAVESNEFVQQHHFDDGEDDDDDDDEFIFKQQQAQHRQFLDNEGYGLGPRTERQKQYDQMKVSRAQHNIFKYKVKNLQPEAENTERAVEVSVKKHVRKTNMRNSMDRLVEDLIQESMSKGEFSNLSGAGKPLDYSKDSPYMDKVTQKMNEVLLQNDFQPEWIMMNKEIRDELQKCRESLALERKQLGEPPYSACDVNAWNTYIQNFRLSLETVNEKIHKFNLIVPMLHRQIMPYDFDREYKRVCENVEEYLPENYENIIKFRSNTRYETSRKVESEKVDFRQLWNDVLAVFRKGENS